MSSPTAPTPALNTITIVLADDHRMVREALRVLLERQDDFEVVADVGDAASALQRVLDHRPSVLVLDLNMPGEISGLDAIARVGDLSPETAVVVLTMQRDPGFARRALGDGARAYVLKESADEELVDAVHQAVEGGRYVALGLRPASADAESLNDTGELTAREIEVLRLIAFGHTNGEIASTLTLSVRTVESHRGRIHRKLGLQRRAELVRYALDRHLLAG
jgi:two-component system, NarL family, response regulator NreC